MTFSYNYFFIILSQKGKIFGRKKESVQKNTRIRKNLYTLYIFPISNEKKYFISPMHKTLYVYRNF